MQKPYKFFSSSSSRALLGLLVAAIGVAGCSAAIGSGAGGTAEYHVSSSRPSAQVTVRDEGDSAVVDIYSDNGIGNATINLVLGEWPDSIIMRFHLQGLEGLDFLYGDIRIMLSVNTQNMVLQSVSEEDGTEKIIEEGSRYWMPVRFLDKDDAAVDAPVAGGVIEVTAPANFHTGEVTSFTINWIDYYR